jgi:hypothetical protein
MNNGETPGLDFAHCTWLQTVLSGWDQCGAGALARETTVLHIWLPLEQMWVFFVFPAKLF